MNTKKKLIAKIIDLLITATMFVLLLPLSRCNDKEKDAVVNTVNTPVYKSFPEFRATKTIMLVQQTVDSEKVYSFDNYLFINEILKGIHVVDNSNPVSPK